MRIMRDGGSRLVLGQGFGCMAGAWGSGAFRVLSLGFRVVAL